MFLVIKNKDGSEEIVTCDLDGTVLPGVTRQSVLDLSKEWKIKTSERKMSMTEFTDLYSQNRIVEVFCSGTATAITPVKEILYKETSYTFKYNGEAGEYANRFYNKLMAIYYGKVEHEFSRRIL